MRGAAGLAAGLMPPAGTAKNSEPQDVVTGSVQILLRLIAQSEDARRRPQVIRKDRLLTRAALQKQRLPSHDREGAFLAALTRWDP
jgi:hypothetical protein